MCRVVNAYSIRPDEIQPGDTMMLLLKAVVTRRGRYRIYRCKASEYLEYFNSGEIPQGARLGGEEAVAEQVFPALLYADMRPDIW